MGSHGSALLLATLCLASPGPAAAQSAEAGSALLVLGGGVLLASATVDVAAAPASARIMGQSPGAALGWSAAATLVPIVAGVAVVAAGGFNDNHTTLAVGGSLASAGAIVGPALGHLYSRRSGRAGRGIVIRALAAAVGAVGLVLIANAPD